MYVADSLIEIAQHKKKLYIIHIIKKEGDADSTELYIILFTYNLNNADKK